MTTIPQGYNPETLRVATWNLLHTDTVTWKERMIEASKHLRDVDVLLIQEGMVDGENDGVAELANLLKMQIVTRHKIIGRDIDAVPEGQPRHESQVAILTHLPIMQELGPVSYSFWEENKYVIALLQSPSGRPIIAATAHFMWGGDNEHIRLKQAIDINRVVRNYKATLLEHGMPAPIAFFGGDLNTLPQSDTIRFLTGLHAVEGEPAFWVDSWIENGAGPGFTSIANNPWSEDTARRSNILEPWQLPNRRIDFLLLEGWVYGRPGYPIKAEIRGKESKTGGILASDHLAIVVELVDTPLTDAEKQILLDHATADNSSDMQEQDVPEGR